LNFQYSPDSECHSKKIKKKSLETAFESVELCTVPKAFPISEIEPKTRSTMNLTRKKIHWIIRQEERKESSGIIAKVRGHLM
jgi:hypothetical protein